MNNHPIGSSEKRRYYTFLSSPSRHQRHIHEEDDEDDEERQQEQKEDVLPLLSEVGGKALSLLQTSRAGLPVPNGYVLTVSFFQPWLDVIKTTKEWSKFIAVASSAGASPPPPPPPSSSSSSSSQAFRPPPPEEMKDLCDAVKKKFLHLFRVDDGQSSLTTEEQKLSVEEATKATFGDAQLSCGQLVAVRSSSPEEDLAGTSFAGGYETTLGVDPSNTRDFWDAVVDSFVSAFDHRVVLYKQRQGMAIDNPRIAVIVQRQVDADTSGVAFTLNPSNNCYDEAVVTASFGLGETVVGGTVTPDTYVVDRVTWEVTSSKLGEKTEAVWLKSRGRGSTGTNGVTTTGGGTVPMTGEGGTYTARVDGPEASALTESRAIEVAKLACQVEGLHGGTAPYDIEWAIDREGLLHLLQARPVTAYVQLFPEMITERGCRDGKRLYLDLIAMTQGFSSPMSVLGLDIWSTFLEAVKPHMKQEGMDGLVLNIHGRQYILLSNMMATIAGRHTIDKVYRTGLVDPAMARALNSIDLNEYRPKTIPSGMRGFLLNALGSLSGAVPGTIRALWLGPEAMNEYRDFAERLLNDCHDEGYLDGDFFDEQVTIVMERFREMLPKVGGITASMLSRWWIHRMFMGREEEADDLLISLCMDLEGNPTSDMGHAMVKLASFPEVRDASSGEEVVRTLRGQTAEGCASCSKEFVAAYEDFMKRFGCRGIKEIDIATPRSYENEIDFFRRLLEIDVENNSIKNVTRRRNDAYDKLLDMARDMGKERAFVHHANIVKLLGYREHPKYMYVAMADFLRRHALKIGKVFVLQGRLEHVDQIFSLHADEVAQAQKDPGMDLLSLVESNMEPYRSVSHVKTWPVLIDSRGKIIRGTRERESGEEETEDGTLLGDPISPGVVKGRAKVLRNPYEKPLAGGEILVARATEPSWTPIFINASGVVMEVGGPLQHGAIIAREYGIPCVSGVVGATVEIKDGDVIEVDGSSGVVKFVVNDGFEGT